jgi:predicted transcriptional regulator
MSNRSDFPLTDSERTALRYILENGPAHGYRVYKESGLKTNKTVYTALRALTEKGLLEKKSAEEKPRPGQPMQNYYLTLTGLSVGLSISDKSWKKIDSIAYRWEHLFPFVFKRWSLFKKHGLAEEVKKALEWSMEVHAMDWRYGHKWVDGGKAIIEERFIRRMVNPSRPIEVRMRWHKVLHSDEELRERLKDYHKNELSISQAFVEQQKIKVKIIAMLQEPEPDLEEIKKLELTAQWPVVYVQRKEREKN